MQQKDRRYARFQRGIAAMSKEEREAIRAALVGLDALPAQFRGEMLDLITEIAAARGRAEDRRRSDRDTDARRRVLVGARVPRDTAERCRKCASLHGLSLYRFVCQALERECMRLTE